MPTKAYATPPGQPTKRVEMTDAETATRAAKESAATTAAATLKARTVLVKPTPKHALVTLPKSYELELVRAPTYVELVDLGQALDATVTRL